MKLLGKLNPNRYLDRWTDAKIAREKWLVTEGCEAERKLFMRGMLRLALGFGALMGADWFPFPYDSLAWMTLGAIVGGTALIWLQRTQAYRNGWLDGRQRIVEQIAKTHNSDELVLVLKHAAEYDMVHVLGFPTSGVPDSPEGLE